MPEEVLISVASIGDDSSLSIEEGKALLSATELKKANKFHFDKHRNRYIRGRALLRTKLSSFTNSKASELTIQEEDRGKPYISNPEIAFNLSHSGDVALYAIAPTLSRIGADIEIITRDADIDGLTKHYYTDGECEEMKKLYSQEKRSLFFKIWTAKEARMKLSGEGLFLDPREIDLSFTEGTPNGYRLPSPNDQHLYQLEYPELNAVASIVADKPFEVRPMP